MGGTLDSALSPPVRNGHGTTRSNIAKLRNHYQRKVSPLNCWLAEVEAVAHGAYRSLSCTALKRRVLPVRFCNGAVFKKSSL